MSWHRALEESAKIGTGLVAGLALMFAALALTGVEPGLFGVTFSAPLVALGAVVAATVAAGLGLWGWGEAHAHDGHHAHR